MPSLLLAFALLAADPISDLLVEINLARIENGVALVEQSDVLQRAAELEAEWFSRYGDTTPLHTIGTAWLKKRYPRLLWSRLYATYGPTLPPLLSSFDVARLCGWGGGTVRDIISQRASFADSVDQWLLTAHRATLLGDFTHCGGAKRGGGQGQVVVAVFGESE